MSGSRSSNQSTLSSKLSSTRLDGGQGRSEGTITPETVSRGIKGAEPFGRSNSSPFYHLGGAYSDHFPKTHIEDDNGQSLNVKGIRKPVAWLYGEHIKKGVALSSPYQSPFGGPDPFEGGADTDEEEESPFNGMTPTSVGPAVTKLSDTLAAPGSRCSRVALGLGAGHVRAPPSRTSPKSMDLDIGMNTVMGTETTIASETIPAASHRVMQGDNVDIVVDSPLKETRIVAPHVDKLSPPSVVEVILTSTSQCVKVLCSVDVLKMQSAFFRGAIIELECQDLYTPSPEGWRKPLTVPEHNPLEAAAFLESLHEGRHMYSVTWSYAWTRLATTWVIPDLEREYALQIQTHVTKIIDTVRTHHWRLNPSVLQGMSIAVFRKSTGVAPVMLLGTVASIPQVVPSGRIRVIFGGSSTDCNSTHSSSNENGCSPSSPSPSPSPSARSRRSYNSGGGNTSSGAYTPIEVRAASRQHNTGMNAGEFAEPSNIGDVTQPFWVKRKSEAWSDPDDIFTNAGFITDEDRTMFWEMVQSLVELPLLLEHLVDGPNGPITVDMLVGLLRRPEYRDLWTDDGHDCLPKGCACTLLKAAYMGTDEYQD